MKKIIFIFAIILVISVGYFYNTFKNKKSEESYTELQGNPSGPVVFKTEKTEASTTPGPSQKIIKTENKDFNQYDKNDKEWLGKIENLLGEKDYAFYLELRKKNEDEKMVAYNEFHEYLRKKYGDNFSYHISEDQSVREKEINTRHTKELLKQIGSEKFKDYLKERDQFNEELLRKSEAGQALVIEF
jgi:uncharacterized short protein YbdD (DUF466 family)